MAGKTNRPQKPVTSWGRNAETLLRDRLASVEQRVQQLRSQRLVLHWLVSGDRRRLADR